MEQTAEIVDWLWSTSTLNPTVVGAGEVVGAGLGAPVGVLEGADEGAELGCGELVGLKLGAGDAEGRALIVGDAVGAGVIIPMSSMFPFCNERRPKTCEYS